MPSIKQAGRADRWWDFRIQPALALGYAASLLYDVPAASTVRCLALIVFVRLCAGSFVHVVNGMSDAEAYPTAGKRNMSGFESRQRLLFCGLIAGLSFSPAAFFHCSPLSLALLGVEYLLLAIHSTPPLRLRERGVLGVLSDSMVSHALPGLYTISVMANEASSRGSPLVGLLPVFPVAGFIWSLCLGVKGNIIRGFQDRGRDCADGISAFAARCEFRNVRPLVNRIYAIELFAFIAILFLLLRIFPILVCMAAAFLLMLCVRVWRNPGFYVYEGSEAATIHWWQLGHPFYNFWFPLILAAQLSWKYSWLVWLPFLQVLVFRDSCMGHLRELGWIYNHARVWSIWRGQLHLDGGAEARVKWTWPNGTRLEIKQGGNELWRLRLTKPQRALSDGGNYRVKLEMRADRPRHITLGVWQNHAPWMSLGLCEDFEISDRWTVVERTFTASENEDHPYLGIWLGGEDVAVDIRHFGLKRVELTPTADGSSSPAPYRIFLAANCWSLNGVNVYSEHLVRGLESNGSDARILMTERKTNLVPPPPDLMIVPADVRTEDLPVAASDSWATHWVALVRYLSRHAPCIFVPNADYRHSCVSPKLPSGVCVVGIVHSDDPVHYEHAARLGRYWDAIVCVSETIARKVAALDTSLVPRLHVISNGIPVPLLCPERTAGTLSATRPLRVVYHGVLNRHQKRILDLAAILHECASRGIPIRMTVAGDGPEREALLQACAPHIQSGVFRYAGLLAHDQIEDLLRQEDVYLLPSAFEGLPNALLEGMAQGCVPLVTDIESGVPELIRDGVNGYRVPVGGIAAFAEHLGMLQAEPNLRARLAAEAHRTVLGSSFDVRTMTASYLRLFGQVLEAARDGSYQRPSGRIAPPPAEVAGISIFPMDHLREVENAERRLLGPAPRPGLLRRYIRHFI